MKLLKRLYAINSKSGSEAAIKELVLRELADVECAIEEDDFGNLFITKGEAECYAGVTAHLDEVHEPVCRSIVTEGDMVYGLDVEGHRVGIGADDKNGLWVILKLLHAMPVLKAVLFVEEEKTTIDGEEVAGCRGSRACSLSAFDDVCYLLAIDRKGSADVVTTSKGGVVLCDESFLPEAILAEYGYACVEGGRTDVTALRERGLTIPCCNISCGYYNAHKSDEYTLFSELEHTLRFVAALVERF